MNQHERNFSKTQVGKSLQKNMLGVASEGIGKKKNPIPVNTNVLCAAEAVCIFHKLTILHYSTLCKFTLAILMSPSCGNH